MIFHLPQTMSLLPIWVILSEMFLSSSKENISPITPHPYHPDPGCSMTLEQLQKSKGNCIRALTIKKGTGCQGAFQDPAQPFELSSLSSPYAANMTSATVDYKVKRQVELARRMELEINRPVKQELQRVPSYAAKSNHHTPQLRVNVMKMMFLKMKCFSTNLMLLHSTT